MSASSGSHPLSDEPPQHPWSAPGSVAPEALAKPLRAHAWACRSDELPSDTAEDLISDKPNRWNVEGEPTVYLSGAPGLALIESGRHPEDLSGKSFLIEVDVKIPLVVDLRDSTTCRTLGLPRDPTWVLDREQTREAASALRHSGICDAILVPGAGALDQPDQWNAVVWADDPRTVGRMISVPVRVGMISLPEDA